ncbi:hypothetical protein CsSME_00014116 [Camellia sinensis var. sinensis]
MASSSSAPFVVVEHTSSEQCFTNYVTVVQTTLANLL